MIMARGELRRGSRRGGRLWSEEGEEERRWPGWGREASLGNESSSVALRVAMVTPFVCVVVLFAAVAWDSALRRAEVLIDMGSSSRKVGGVGGQVGEGRSSSGGDGSLEAVEKRLDSMSERFSGLEGRFSKIKMQQRELNGEQEELSDKEGGLRGAMRQTAKQIAALRGKVDIIQARREEHDIFSPPAARPKKLSQTALLRGTVPKKAPGPRLKILGMMPSVAEARGRRIISDAGVSKYAKEYDAEAREQERRYRDHVRVWMRQQRQYVKKEEAYRKGVAAAMATQAGLIQSTGGYGGVP